MSFADSKEETNEETLIKTFLLKKKLFASQKKMLFFSFLRFSLLKIKGKHF